MATKSSPAKMVGVVKDLIGSATATDAQGVVRQLQVGDKIYANDVIQTSAGGTVQIEFNDQRFATIGHGDSLALDNTVFNPNAVDANAQNDQADIAQLQAAIAKGLDPTTVAAATAAGPTGAGAEGAQEGHSFVTLALDARQAENPSGISTTTFSYSFTDPPVQPAITPLEAAPVNIPPNPGNDGPNRIPDLPPVVEAASASLSEEGLKVFAAPNPDDSPANDTTNNRVASGSIRLSDVDSNALTVTLSAPTDSQLKLNGESITWSGSGTQQLIGSTAEAGDVIKIEINDQGQYSVTLLKPIDHPDTSSEDVVSFNVGVSVADANNTVSTNLSLRIEDDSPTISLARSQTIGGAEGNDMAQLSGKDEVLHTSEFKDEPAAVPLLVVSDGNFAVDAQRSFADQFVSSYGADGPGQIAYSFNLLAENRADIGIVDTASGEIVSLYLNQARTSVAGRISSGEVVFTISVDGNGVVTLDQQRAVQHQFNVRDVPLEGDYLGPLIEQVELIQPHSLVALPNDSLDQPVSELPQISLSPPGNLVSFASNILTLTATITDRDGDAQNATIDLAGKVAFRDDQPIAYPDSGNVAEDASDPISGNLLTNDHLSNDLENVVTAQTLQGSFGTLKLDSDGAYSYTLNNQNSQVQALGAHSAPLFDTFTYTVTDGDGSVSSSSLTIKINGTNDAPVAVDDRFVTNALDTPITFDALFAADGTGGNSQAGNDFDIDSASFTSITLTQLPNPADGVLVLIDGNTKTPVTLGMTIDVAQITAGALVFQAATSPSGTPSFHYTVSDGQASSNEASVTISLALGEVLASNLRVELSEEGLTNGLPEQGDHPITVGSGTLPIQQIRDGGNNELHLPPVTLKEPDGAWQSGGSDIHWTLSEDGHSLTGSTNTQTVIRIEITTANNQYQYAVNLLAPLDHAQAGEDVTIIPVKVVVTLNQVSGATLTHTLGIIVSDDTPLAVNDSVSVSEDSTSAVSGNVVVNDSSGADTPATVAWGAPTPSYGTLLFTNDGTYIYTVNTNNPAVQELGAGQSLTETFSYTLKDADGDRSSATLTITINGSSLTPHPFSDADEVVVTLEDTVMSGTVLAGTSSVEGNVRVMSFQIAGDARTYQSGDTAVIADKGSLQINSDGRYSFTPVADFNGPVPVATYTLSDGFTSDRSTLSINVIPVNDAPLAQNDSNAISENTLSITSRVPGVLGNDTDVDSPTLTVTGVRTGAERGSGTAGTVGNQLTGEHGALTLNANGSYTYTLNNEDDAVNALNSSQSLTDRFTYTVSDGSLSDTAQLVITINGVTDANGFVIGSSSSDNSQSSTSFTVSAGSGAIVGAGGDDVLSGDPGGSVLIPGTDANLVFVLDSSGSMSDSIRFGNSTITRMQALKNAMSDALTDLKNSTADNIRVHLVDFDSNATSLGTFDLRINGVANNTELTSAIAAVNKIKADGYTNYEAGLQTALNWINGKTGTAPLINADVNKVLFISDGEPNRAYHANGTTEVDSVSSSAALQHILGTYDVSGNNNDDTASEVKQIQMAGDLATQTDQAFKIEAVGINVNGTAWSILDQVEGQPAGSTGNHSADNITTADQLATVIGTLAGSEITQTPAGNDSMSGGMGNDLIFGDALNSDALAAARGLSGSFPAGSGWGVFAALEAHQGTGSSTWDRAATLDYIKNHQAEVATETGRTGGHDTISGGSGNDTIYGQEGNDILVGAAGNDNLFGGTGSDTFKFSMNNGTDVIGDFKVGAIDSDGDVLDIHDLLSGAAPANSNLVSGGFLQLSNITVDSANNKTTVTISIDSDGSAASAHSLTPLATVTMTGIATTDANLLISTLLQNHQIHNE